MYVVVQQVWNVQHVIVTCTEHTIGDGVSYNCKSCIDLFEKRRVANEKAIQEKLKKSMWCDFCGLPVDSNSCLSYGGTNPNEFHNPDCYICKKHGQVFIVNVNRRYDRWDRCIDHLKKPVF